MKGIKKAIIFIGILIILLLTVYFFTPGEYKELAQFILATLYILLGSLYIYYKERGVV